MLPRRLTHAKGFSPKEKRLILIHKQRKRCPIFAPRVLAKSRPLIFFQSSNNPEIHFKCGIINSTRQIRNCTCKKSARLVSEHGSMRYLRMKPAGAVAKNPIGTPPHGNALSLNFHPLGAALPLPVSSCNRSQSIVKRKFSLSWRALSGLTMPSAFLLLNAGHQRCLKSAMAVLQHLIASHANPAHNVTMRSHARYFCVTL